MPLKAHDVVKLAITLLLKRFSPGRNGVLGKVNNLLGSQRLTSVRIEIFFKMCLPPPYPPPSNERR